MGLLLPRVPQGAVCFSTCPTIRSTICSGWSPLSCRPTGAGCSVLLPSMVAHALRGWKRLSSLGFEVTSVISDTLWEEGINVNIGSLSASNATIFKGRFGDDYPSVWGNKDNTFHIEDEPFLSSVPSLLLTALHSRFKWFGAKEWVAHKIL